MSQTKSDLPQGTLDLLALKVIALGPVHGYAIALAPRPGVARRRAGAAGLALPGPTPARDRGLLAASWQRLSDAVGLILKISEGGAR